MRNLLTRFVFPIALGLILGFSIKPAQELITKRQRLQLALPFAQNALLPAELQETYSKLFRETVKEILDARALIELLKKPAPPEREAEPPPKKISDMEILTNVPRSPRGLLAYRPRETLLSLVRHCKDGKPIGELIPKLQYYDRRCVNEALDPLRRSGISVTGWYKLSTQQLLTPSG